MAPNETIQVCDRCNTPVVFTDVSDGYYAVCPNHDEDLYKIEVKSIPIVDSITLENAQDLIKALYKQGKDLNQILALLEASKIGAEGTIKEMEALDQCSQAALATTPQRQEEADMHSYYNWFQSQLKASNFFGSERYTKH